MTLTRWSPVTGLAALEIDRLNRMFDAAFSGEPLPSGGWVPPSTSSRPPTRTVVVKAELPEMKREDIKITFENNVLTIEGERKFAEAGGLGAVPPRRARLRRVPPELHAAGHGRRRPACRPTYQRRRADRDAAAPRRDAPAADPDQRLTGHRRSTRRRHALSTAGHPQRCPAASSYGHRGSLHIATPAQFGDVLQPPFACYPLQFGVRAQR